MLTEHPLCVGAVPGTSQLTESGRRAQWLVGLPSPSQSPDPGAGADLLLCSFVGDSEVITDEKEFLGWISPRETGWGMALKHGFGPTQGKLLH